MKIKSFKEFNMDIDISEVLYEPDGTLISKFNGISELGKLIYSGRTEYNLYDNKQYFIVTDKQNNILFYQAYQVLTPMAPFRAKYKMFNVRSIYILKQRENVSKYNSNHKGLFKQLIYSLLFLGYILKDDNKHNLLSRKSIESLYYNGELSIYYGKNNNIQLLDIDNFELLFDNDINTGIYYVNKDVSKDNLLENIILNENYESAWKGHDLFDDIKEYMD